MVKTCHLNHSDAVCLSAANIGGCVPSICTCQLCLTLLCPPQEHQRASIPPTNVSTHRRFTISDHLNARSYSSRAHYQQALSERTTLSEDGADGQGSTKAAKLFRCLRPGCRHQYKQLSGLRYHMVHVSGPARTPSFTLTLPDAGSSRREAAHTAKGGTSDAGPEDSDERQRG